MITRPDEYGHNNPDLAFVDSTFVRGGTRAVANLTALYALSSKVDQLAERITRVWVASEAKYYVLTNIASVGSASGWTAEQTNSTLQQVTDNGATTTNTITAAGFTTSGNLTAGGIVSTNQFYAGATNYTNSIFVGWDATAVYLGYQMGNLFIDIGTGVTNKVRLRNTGGFQIESLAGSGTRMLVADSSGNISVQSIPSVPVTSVFGRTGTVTAQSGDYTTAQVTESGNLYYTDARARAAISFAAGSGAYNSTTGVITIPTDNNQIANSAGYITTISGITAGGELSGTYPNPTLVTSAVTGKLLTGVNVTGGSISASDSILSAFGKLQNQINGLLGGSIFQSTWNASTNSPSLASGVGTKGYYYIVSVAGSTNLDGVTDWQVGDWAIFDGTVWRKVDNTDAVSSVNGFTGAVSLTTSNISEGSGLYYTDARARAAISVSGSLSYNSSTGVISYIQPTNISTFTNDSGYVTTSGARAALSAGTGISYNSTTGVITSTITQYTDANARAALSFAAGSGAYNSTTGVITIPTNTNQLTNGAGFITGITSGMVTTALGYTPPQPNGTGASGTWGISISGNAATATNATQWNGVSYSGSVLVGTAPVYLLGWDGSQWRPADPSSSQLFLGLGSYAYRSSGLAELSGATFTGAINFGTESRLAGNEWALLSGAANNELAINYNGKSNAPLSIYNGANIGSTPAFKFNPNGISWLNGGNVGIGTTSPTENLELYRDQNATTRFIVQNPNSTSTSARASIITVSNTVIGEMVSINSLGLFFGTASNHDLNFITNGNTRATISSTGATTFSSSVSAASFSASGLYAATSDQTTPTGGAAYFYKASAGAVVSGYQFLVETGSAGSRATRLTINDVGAATFASSVTATSFIRSGGTSSQFLKADGSIDSNTYLTSAVTSATGTTNQIVVSASTGAVTFSLPSAVTISGNMTAAGFFESSDARKKTIIEKYAGSGVDTYKYTFNETGLDHYGYIAQEVEKVLPNAVTTREDGMKDVRYSEVHTFKIMLLENHIERLEEEIKQLKNAIQ